LGATHVINTATEDLIATVRSLTDGNGSSVTIDATGFMPLIKDGLEFTRNKGKMVILGVPSVDANLDLNLVEFMSTGKSILGSIEGDAIPREV
jgi:Zn-dependent alcohol dehydrogenase